MDQKGEGLLQSIGMELLNLCLAFACKRHVRDIQISDLVLLSLCWG